MAVGIGFVGFFTAAPAQRFIVPAIEEDIERVQAHESAGDAALLGPMAAMRPQLEEMEAAIRRRLAPPD